MKPERDIPLFYDGVRIGTVIDVEEDDRGLKVQANLDLLAPVTSDDVRAAYVEHELEPTMRFTYADLRRMVNTEWGVYFDDRPLPRPE